MTQRKLRKLRDPGLYYFAQALVIGGMMIFVAGIAVGKLWVFILGCALFLVGLSLAVFG